MAKPARPSNALTHFHPIIAEWFRAELGEPTEVQARSWPVVAAGEHALLIAPTGSGKTLAAFLWAIDRLLTGAWSPGGVRVVYVSPLKALGNDVQRNLLAPLAKLSDCFAAAGRVVPDIRVLTRTGDTPADERQRMIRRPPEILVTTPESLNILLTSRRGRMLLTGVRSVILDEVHAIAGNKLGVHLITAIERLVALAGEVQRVALSATVRPAERIAAWVGGSVAGVPRRVSVVETLADKRYEIQVQFPAEEDRRGDRPVAPTPGADQLWSRMVASIRPSIAANRSTLIFANARRSVEKLTRLLNETGDAERVFAHHGSLSREIRAVVEQRLKAGELAAVVATNSLELGIDVGSLDEVILFQAPPSVASTLQRAGRAGHTVGQTSRARLLALIPRELLPAAVVARAALEGAIEPLRPVGAALDVLAQVIVSSVATAAWRLDDLYETVRRAEPYHALSRRVFDSVVDMLAGRYQTRRLRSLDALVFLDREAGTIHGLPGAERRVYMSGGTIPDRGYFHLRVAGSSALIGDLDEEFVWERSVGDSFTLGVQSWRIERMTHNDVFVTPSARRSAMAPFWRAEERHRPFELSERIGLFLEQAEPRLDDPDFPAVLCHDYPLTSAAAGALVQHLIDQRRATQLLPHRHRLVVERVREGQDEQIILHTLAGGRVNLPWSLALREAWQRRHGSSLDVLYEDDCIVVDDARGIDADELLAALAGQDVRELVYARLPLSGVFGARFREAAATALLLPRAGFTRRTPLWLSRQRAKELFEAVSGFPDFPLVLEAWRACVDDVLDLDALEGLLGELASGRIAVHHATTAHPSPFSSHVQWKRTNELMYADDTPLPGTRPNLSRELISEVARSAHLRPRLSPALVETLQRKLQRTAPGYEPRTREELLALIEERVAIRPSEWRELVEAMERSNPSLDLPAVESKLAMVELPGASSPFVGALVTLPRLLAACGVTLSALRLRAPFGGQPLAADAAADETTLAELASEVLRFYGPVPRDFLRELLGVSTEAWEGALGELLEDDSVVIDELTADAAGPEVSDSENLERLLRLTRASARPQLTPLPLAHLPLFLATWQDLASQAEGPEATSNAIERLFGYPAPASLWETEILPARLARYLPAWLDALFGETELLWIGCGPERLALTLSAARELFTEPRAPDVADDELERLLPSGPGRFAFEELLPRAQLSSAELSRHLWDSAWRGAVTNDGFAAVRRGIETRFAPAEPDPDRGRSMHAGRLRFGRWKGTRPFAGSWYRLDPPVSSADPLDEDERQRDRVRVLIERYGVLFRELLERELPLLSWGRLFRSLRLMELSGELVAGQFFLGVPGLQFASPAAVRLLQDGLAARRVFWVNALDPISPCGLNLEWDSSLPRRVPSNHLVFDGAELVLLSEQQGKKLDLRTPPDHPTLPDYLGLFKTQLSRPVRPASSIVVETINGAPAAESPYRAVLEGVFHVVRDVSALRLSRRY